MKKDILHHLGRSCHTFHCTGCFLASKGEAFGRRKDAAGFPPGFVGSRWAKKKRGPGCLIGILMSWFMTFMKYSNHINNWVGFHPQYILKNLFFSLLRWNPWTDIWCFGNEITEGQRRLFWGSMVLCIETCSVPVLYCAFFHKLDSYTVISPTIQSHRQKIRWGGFQVLIGILRESGHPYSSL